MIEDFYEPAEDSMLLLEEVRKFARGMALDMGTGSGILAVEASKKCGSVIAADISLKVLAIAKLNAKKENRKNIKFIRSDLFENISGRFDTIIFNPPYLPQDEGVKDAAIYGGKQGYELSERFFDSANDYLRNDGIILFLFSSLTGKDKIDTILADRLFEVSQVASKHLFFEELYVYLIRKSATLKALAAIKDLRLYARGKRGIVYIGKHKGNKVAIKVKNPRSGAAGRIQIEAHQLTVVNKKGIGPKLIESGEGYFIMGFVEGLTILDFFRKMSKRRIIQVISQIFGQLHVLDRLGLNKEEMHHPIKHIIINGNQPVLIDFERAKYSQKPHNVTQFCQFLASKNVREKLDDKGIIVDNVVMMKLASRYSKLGDDKNLKMIIDYISAGGVRNK